MNWRVGHRNQRILILGHQVVGRSYRPSRNLDLINGVAGHCRTGNGLVVSTRPFPVPLGHARGQVLGATLLHRNYLDVIDQRVTLFINHWLAVLINVVNLLGNLLGPLVVNNVVNQVNKVVIALQLVGYRLTFVACHTWIQDVRCLVALRVLIQEGLVALAPVAKVNRGLVVTRHFQFCQRFVSRVVDKSQGCRLSIRGVNHRHRSILILIEQGITGGDRRLRDFGLIRLVASYLRAQYRRVITAGPITVPSRRPRL